MANTIPKTTVEFIVRGDETYYVLLDFGKTRKEVIGVVRKITLDTIEKLKALPSDPGKLTIKLILKSTRQKAVKFVVKKVSPGTAFAMEYILVAAQKQMLDEVAKL